MTQADFVDKWSNNLSKQACSCCSSDEGVRMQAMKVLRVLTDTILTWAPPSVISDLDGALQEATR